MKQKNYIIEIKLPENVNVQKQDDILIFSGPLGSTGVNLKKIDPLGSSAILIKQDIRSIFIITQSKSYQGLLKKKLLNKIEGITRGFLVYLKIIWYWLSRFITKKYTFLKIRV